MSLHAIHKNQLLTQDDAVRFLDSTLLSDSISQSQSQDFKKIVMNTSYTSETDHI